MAEPELSASFYGTAAGLYDLVATAPGVMSWRRRTVETLGVSAGDTVVEMGCGTGANMPFLREQVGSDGRVVGVDLVPAMLQEAQNRIERAGWKNVHVVEGDATQPPVDTADALVSTFVVGMLDDPAGATREWLDCVSPGGRVTLLNAGRSPRAVTAPLNLGLRLFVRVAAPGRRLSLTSPTRELERRWAEARDALFEAGIDQHEERLGLGLVPLMSVRVPE
ncbi:class I SAM-dependent methyltransferase [Halovenus rubra]|uniref:Class I SAM-dependent methyltransferase n=2 Tax=Halovenus rubra TaxID=869890 RepID=A0ABD5X420_9EURY|nr:methyltransferase domain-containing protein [Halovenus rubra]